MPVTRQPRSGFQETDEAGVDSYSSGGVTVQSAIGRVDQVDAEIDNSTYVATAYPDPNTPGAFVVELHNVSDGTEVADATDISADTITYEAHRY